MEHEFEILSWLSHGQSEDLDEDMSSPKSETHVRILDAARRAKAASTEAERQMHLRKQEALEKMEEEENQKSTIRERAE